MDSTKHTDQEVHKSVVIPYIKALSENIKKRFNDKVAAMCSATSIFDPIKVKDDVRYGMTEVVQLASLHSSLNVPDLQNEWKIFRNKDIQLQNLYCRIWLLKGVILQMPLLLFQYFQRLFLFVLLVQPQLNGVLVQCVEFAIDYDSECYQKT